MVLAEASEASVAHLDAASVATVTIYGHVDVQPVDPLELWDSPPFELTAGEMGGEAVYFGRGSTDDKGNLLAALAGVEDLLAETDGRLPVRLKFFVEGQEEIGSPQLSAFIASKKEVLATDYVFSADGTQPGLGKAGVVLGLRGAMAMQIDVQGPERDLHSGFWGGAVANPLASLARMLSSLHNEDGSIAVPGFYDDCKEPPAAELASMKAFPYSETEAKAELGVSEWSGGEPSRSHLERKWTRPTIEVVGMGGGFQGEGIKTVLPARASAKLSSRLVPGQTPHRALELVTAHLQAQAAKLPGVRVNVSELTFKAQPYYAPADSPGNAAATRALRREYGAEPVLYRIGASIPAVGMFMERLGVPTTIFAFGEQDNRAHSPNEFYRAASMLRCRRLYSAILPLVAEEHAKAAGVAEKAASKDEL